MAPSTNSIADTLDMPSPADRSGPPPFAVIDEPETAEAVFRPHRLRVLEAFGTPSTATDVAEKLGLPRQKVGYHVRVLEDRGLLRPVRRERRGNFVAKVLERSAATYAVSAGALGELALDPSKVRDRFSTAYLAALASRTLTELGRLRARADAEGKKLATLSLETRVSFDGPEAQAAFAEDLQRAVQEVVARHTRPTGAKARSFRVILGSYPEPKDAATATRPAPETFE